MNVEKIEQLESLVKEKIKGKIIDQTVTRLTQPGENYLSVVLKVDITVKKEDGSEEIVPTVAKLLPPKTNTQFDAMGTFTFKNEIAWYEHIIPAIKKFQKSHGVKNVADFFAESYGGRLSLDPGSDAADSGAVILLENLKVRGFENFDRHEGFDLDTAKAILQRLATFHAVPIAMKLENKEMFEDRIKSRLQVRKVADDNGSKPRHHEQALIHIEKLIKSDPKCASLWSRVSAVNKDFFGVRPTVREPWATVVHSDFWTNNIMVKPQNGTPPRVKILDLQISPYKSPICDVIFFLFTSLKYDLLESNFDELVTFYYDHFIENLKQLNADTTLFPYKDYLDEIGVQIRASELMHSLLFMFIIMAPKENAQDVAETGYNLDNILDRLFRNEPSESHRKRLSFVVQECARRNWI